jgi:hypothetical protein
MPNKRAEGLVMARIWLSEQVWKSTKAVAAASGTNASRAVVALLRWYIGEPDAQLPQPASRKARVVEQPPYREPVTLDDGSTETMYPDSKDPARFVGVLDCGADGLGIHARSNLDVHHLILLTREDAELFAAEIARRAKKET